MARKGNQTWVEGEYGKWVTSSQCSEIRKAEEIRREIYLRNKAGLPSRWGPSASDVSRVHTAALIGLAAWFVVLFGAWLAGY